MALTTHDGTFFFRQMAAFAVRMKSLHQGRLLAGYLYFMAVGTQHVFRGFVFELDTVFVDMMTLVAFINFSCLVVRFVFEDRRHPFRIGKRTVVYASISSWEWAATRKKQSATRPSVDQRHVFSSSPSSPNPPMEMNTSILAIYIGRHICFDLVRFKDSHLNFTK